MIQTILAAAALLFAPAAHAADDGGFGAKRFSDQAPVALESNGAFDPSAVEPAAGAEAAQPDPSAQGEPAKQDDTAASDDDDADRPPAE
jgi:hypothetical protein